MYEIEPRELIYNRTGNFSQTTALNADLAGQFMKTSDLRFDVVIADSGKKPEQSAVAVGSDVLAWRLIVPLSELTKIVLKPKKFHQIEMVNNQYKILIHDQIIDDDIRRKKPENAKAYETDYLDKLKGEVKSGLGEIIRWEKLGLRVHWVNWQIYFIAGLYLPSAIMEGDLERIAQIAAVIGFVVPCAFTFMNNALVQRHQNSDHLDPSINPRDWKYAMMPPVPVDKWIKGSRFLAQHGNDLIIPRS